MGNSTEQKETFHLGLTMAGAVSAGAYTGGVMDYLFEVLDKWEKAKKAKEEGLEKVTIDGKEIELKYVPEHNVVIDAMGGTSAGGMTTVMAALYAIKGEINPVTDKQKDQVGDTKNNIFYDSWINLVDEPGKNTLNKALSTNDLKEHKKILSALNSEFIDDIADKAFALDGASTTNPIAKLPSYISKDVEMLISHTMLRGIPLNVPFPNNISSLQDAPVHSSYEHFLFSHFKLNNGQSFGKDPQGEDRVVDNGYFWLNPYHDDIKEHLKLAAIATGAFPAGLRYREFDDSNYEEQYLKTMLSRLIKGDMGENTPDLLSKINWSEKYLSKIITNYKTVSVDGGAINNEPYGEVLSILKRNHGEAVNLVNKEKYQKYGVVMIDPFPDFPEIRADYEHPQDLIDVLPEVISTLKDQSKIKRRDMVNQFDDEAYRGVIFPVKHKPVKGEGRYKYPIACGSIGAFGGFLDITFRHHDFYLGRNNARNFIRAFLSMPYDPDNSIIHPIHRGWSDKMKKRFLITYKDKHYLPVIPDMNMLIDGVSSADEAYFYSVKDFPTISNRQVRKLRRPLRKRISAMIRYFKKTHLNADYDGNIVNKGWAFTKNLAGGLLVGLLRPIMARKMAKEITKYIIKDLKKRGLIS